MKQFMVDSDKVNDLIYLMDEEDGTSVYAMYMNGEPVFYVYANKNVYDMPIFISKPEFDAPRIPVPGARAFLIDDMSRINGNSVKAVVFPSLAWLIAALYVPKSE